MLITAMLALAVPAPAGITATLKMNPQLITMDYLREHHQGFMPTPVKLDGRQPTGVAMPAGVEPGQFGTLTIGNGPRAHHTVMLSGSTLYVDVNADGRLVPVSAKREVPKDGGSASYMGLVVVRGSWGTATREASTAPYGVTIYWMDGWKQVAYFRSAARTGAITIGGKHVPLMLADGNNDGIYSMRYDRNPPAAGRWTPPVALMIGSTVTTSSATFEYGGRKWLANVSPDGSRFTMSPTTQVVAIPAPPQPKMIPLLASGTVAPDFEAIAPDGSTVHFADYARGKVTILKFWATWCGPCKASLPHFQSLLPELQKNNVAILAVCVWDQKPAYDDFVKTNASKYTFPTAFDPAGRGDSNIAKHLYNVSGIPTEYVIGADGRIVDSIVGWEDGDTRLEKALQKAGVNLSKGR